MVRFNVASGTSIYHGGSLPGDMSGEPSAQQAALPALASRLNPRVFVLKRATAQQSACTSLLRGTSCSVSSASSSGRPAHVPLGLARALSQHPLASVSAASGLSDEEPSGQQLWLQEQLLKLPFMSSVRRERERLVEERRLAEEAEAYAEEQARKWAQQEANALLAAAAEQEAAEKLALAAEKAAGKHQKQQKPKQAKEGKKKKGKGKGKEDKPVRQPPSPIDPEDEALWQAFAEMDANGDNELDFVELRQALEGLGLPCTPEYLVQMMIEYDTNQDNKIDWEEFRYYVHRRDIEIEKAFRAFDIDGDGEITREELGRVLRSAGIPAAETDLRRMVEKLDGDANARISYDEFRRFAAFLPSTDMVNTNPMLFAAWWNASHTSGLTPGGGINSARSRGYDIAHQRSFVFFDIFIRGSLSLALIALLYQFVDW
mmetsp:Transcript_17034/g.42648  ORF Transcript_17034/g.42648 Transcript_17034/m.42648 type:complete len:431 (+) Transcript_17034:306-1598(+)